MQVDPVDPAREALCVLPWIHLATTVDGVWGRCCYDATNYYDYLYARPEKPAFVLHEDAIGCVPGSPFAEEDPTRAVGVRAAFNSPNMRRTRVEMLNSRRPAACRFCYEREDEGNRSHRQAMNDEFSRLADLEQLIQRTRPNGSLEAPPISLDLRFGNRCNLACIMCAYPISSRWGAIRRPAWAQARIEPFGDDQFWTELEEIAPHLRFIYFAGGEPLLQSLHFRMLDLLSRLGVANRIDLHYNSNLTILPPTIFGRWGDFHHVVIAASCDGTGEVFERIRAGARWDRFVANVRVAKGHIELWLDVTVQRDNLGELPAIVAFGRAEGVRVRLENLLQYPEELSIRNLPTTDKARHRTMLTHMLAVEGVRGDEEMQRQLSQVQRLLDLAPAI